MELDRWERIQELFAEALDLPPAEREAYLRHAGDDAPVIGEVRALLAAHDAPGGLDRVAEGLGAWRGQPGRPAEAPPPPRRVGPYAVLEAIAHGGMGSVYLAERADGHARYRVALKLLRRDLDSEDLRRRFLAERHILARITHPNIARLLDAGITDEGRPYFAMEHVEGEPIDDYCDRTRRSIPQRLELFRVVCDAVQHAHRNLVVHRDLKPDNILVTADGTVKLLDFGIAKVLDPEAFPEVSGHTRTGMRLLTPEYASPEQLRDEPVTTASDVYQLGLLLYVLLAGRRPRLVGTPGVARAATREITRPSLVVTRGLPAASPDERAETATAVAAARGTTPDRLRRGLAGDLDNIVLLALREEPERRYGSVEQFREDVRRHLVGLPVAARADTLGYLAAKFVRRHRTGVAVAAALGLVIAASAVGIMVQASRVARERDRAREVSGLLVDLFRSANPEVTGGDTLTALHVLDRGVDRIRTGLAGNRDLQGTMLATVSQAYRGLGQFDRAAELSGEALALNLDAKGPDHPETIQTLVLHARLLVLLEYPDSALVQGARAVELARDRFGDDGVWTARALFAYGQGFQFLGELDSARASIGEAVDVFRAVESGASRDLADALLNLGWIEENLGNVDSAETLLRASLALRRTIPDPQSVELANGLVGLGDLLTRKGALAEAEALITEALAVRREVYPPGHPSIAIAEVSEARLLGQRGDVHGAEQRLRNALAVLRDNYGARVQVVAQVLNDLGLLLHERRFDSRAATPLLREAASIFAELRGPDDPWTAGVRVNLAEALFAQYQTVEAESLLRAAIPVLEAHQPRSVALGNALLNRGLILVFLDRAAEGEPLLRRALDIQLAGFGPDDARVARVQTALGLSLVRQEELREAESLLLGALGALEEAGERGPYPSIAARALGELYTLLDRPEDAARYQPPP